MSTSKLPPEGHAFSEKQLNMLQHVSEVAPSKLGHFKKAYAQKSLRAAITAKCLECVSLESAEIRKCSSSSCPLYTVRPRPHRNAENTNAPRALEGEDHGRIAG